MHRDLVVEEGEFSRTWRYRFGVYSAVASVDYPFEGFHPLTGCYLSRGWSRNQWWARLDAAGRQPAIEATFLQPHGRHGYLLFCVCNQHGDTVDGDRGILRELRGRLALWLGRWGGKGGAGGASRELAATTFQVQVFIESERPLSEAERDQAQAFFQHISSVIRRVGSGGETR